MNSADDLQKAAWLGGLVFANLGGLLAAYVAIRERLVRIETIQAIQGKDIDGLAAVIGTPRSKGLKDEAPK
jgi:hypothetical protein